MSIKLSKYSLKGIDLLQHTKIQHSFNIDMECIQYIFNKIRDSYNSNYNCNYRKFNIKKCHDKLTPPSIFYKLQHNKKPKKLQAFLKWYRENHHTLNGDEICSYYDNDIKNDMLTRLYELMYKHQFISLDVIQHIETSDIIYYKVQHGNINLHIYVPTTQIKIIKNIDKKINDIIHIIVFMQSFKNYTGELNITCFFGKQKKQYDYFNNPNNNNVIPENVNSGVTMYYYKSIYIWRYEELFKVLIHELIHFLKIDFTSIHANYHILDEYIVTNFSLYCNSETLRNGAKGEAYTDFLAILIHTIYISYKLDNSLDNFEKYIIIESNFMLFQIAKLFYSHTQICQTTSVISYYLV
jgi:hypothetical protein